MLKYSLLLLAGVILGLSKLARLAELYARRLQQPNQLAQQITEGLNSCARCNDVACVVELTSTGSAEVRRQIVTAKRGGFCVADSPLWEEFVYTLTRDYAKVRRVILDTVTNLGV